MGDLSKDCFPVLEKGEKRMEWLTLLFIIIIVGMYELWTRAQVARYNNSVEELDDLDR
jgi:hypothetical protein